MKFCHSQQHEWTLKLLFLVKYVRQAEKKNTVRYHLYVESKNNINESMQKTETDIENKAMITNGMKGGTNWEYGINRYTILYVK